MDLESKQKPRVITPGLFAVKPVNPEPDLPSLLKPVRQTIFMFARRAINVNDL